jgi:hypothetical protein
MLVGQTKEKRPLEKGEDTSIILKLGLKSSEGVEWIQLAQVMVEWRAFVKPVMNLRVP